MGLQSSPRGHKASDMTYWLSTHTDTVYMCVCVCVCLYIQYIHTVYIYIHTYIHYIYNVCIYVYGEREKDFFNIWLMSLWGLSSLADWRPRSWCYSLSPSTDWRQNSFFLKGLQSFLFEPSTDWMRPIHINRLYSKSTDLNINLIWKIPSQQHLDSIWIDIPVAFREFSQGYSKTFVERTSWRRAKWRGFHCWVLSLLRIQLS